MNIHHWICSRPANHHDELLSAALRSGCEVDREIEGREGERGGGRKERGHTYAAEALERPGQNNHEHRVEEHENTYDCGWTRDRDRDSKCVRPTRRQGLRRGEGIAMDEEAGSRFAVCVAVEVRHAAMRRGFALGHRSAAYCPAVGGCIQSAMGTGRSLITGQRGG